MIDRDVAHENVGVGPGAHDEMRIRDASDYTLGRQVMQPVDRIDDVQVQDRDVPGFRFPLRSCVTATHYPRLKIRTGGRELLI